MSSISSGMSATALYQQIVKKGQSAAVAEYVKQTPSVAAAEKAFAKSVARYSGPNDLFSHYNDLKFVLTSLGAPSQLENIGLLKKVVASKASDPNSLVNKLNNSSLKLINQVLNTNGSVNASLKDPTIQAQFNSAYELQAFQSNLSNLNPAVAPALNFASQIKNAKSIYDILGNSTLRSVVATVGRIPQQVVNQTLEAQAAAFAKVFDVKKANDSNYVQTFVKRFLGTSDADAAAAGGGSSALLGLFSSNSGSSGGLGLTSA